MPHLSLLRPAAALGAVLLAAACSAGTPAADPSPTAATPASTPSAAPALPGTTPPGAAPPETTAPAAPTPVPSVTPAGPQVRRLEVTVRTDGPVTGDTGTVDVAVGEPVELTVTSDVADEVHVHGSDVRADIPPGGGTVVLTFAQPAPGRYEVELETSGRVLLRLQAR